MGANSFLSLPTIAAGASGAQASINLVTLVPPSGIGQDITFAVAGDFIGDIEIQGSVDGTSWSALGVFTVAPPPEGLIATTPSLEPLVVTSVTVQFLRAFVSAAVRSAVTIGVAAEQNCSPGGMFPGFGGAPPAVASASAAGVANLASRSDHTHALDIVAYNPSLAGMQASGIVQQTYAAPTATPVATNIGASRVPYGTSGGTGIVTSSTSLLFNDSLTPPAFAVQQTGGSATAANIVFQIQAIDETGFGTRGISSELHRTTGGVDGTSAQYTMRKSRGTFAAPTAVQNDDSIGNILFGPYSGTAYLSAVTISTVVDHTATIDATHVPTNLQIRTNLGANVSAATVSHLFGYAGDAVLGFVALATNATQGFVWLRSTAGVPTGVVVTPTVNAGTATTAIATVIDSTDTRLYGNFGGTWKLAPFGTITAPGAVAVAITNAPAGAGATPAEYLAVIGTGGATRWIPLI